MLITGLLNLTGARASFQEQGHALGPALGGSEEQGELAVLVVGVRTP